MFSNSPSFLNRLGWLAVLAILTLLAAPAAFAGNVTMTTGDGSGFTSYTNTGHWSPAGVPTAGNNYFTAGNQMRSPVATGTMTFAGDSLSIDAGGYLQGKEIAATTLNLNFANGTGLFLNGGGVYSAQNNTGLGLNILEISGTVTANASTTTYLGALGKGNGSAYEILDMNSAIGGSGNLIIGGAGTVTSDDAGQLSGVVQFDAANTISGTVTVTVPNGNGGITSSGIGNKTLGLLNINNLNALQNATLALGASFGTTNTTSFASAANSGIFNVGALSGSGNMLLADTAGVAVTLNVGGNNASTAYSGNLSGLGSLIKSGSGAMTLSGADTYTGTTTVNVGTLLRNGTHVGGGNYSVSGILGGSGTITPGSGAGITINGGGILSPGAGVGISTLTLNGLNTTTLLSLASGATLSYDLNTGLQSDQTAIINGVTGDVLFNNTVINFIDLSGGSLTTGQYILFSSDAANTYTGLTTSGPDIIGGLTIGYGVGAYVADLETSGNNIILNITAVPEPTTLALAGLGGVALLVLRRKKV